MIDTHIHSRFSPDGYCNAEDIIVTAIRAGASFIAITDHMDCMRKTTLIDYVDVLSRLKERYKKLIYVCVGIECSWNKRIEMFNKKMLDNVDVEYIINSVHDINGTDFMYISSNTKRSKNVVYDEYFNAVLKSLDAPYKFHTIGHLGCISRSTPYADSAVHYVDHKSFIDAILTKMIKKEIILELNTSVYGAKSQTLPSFEVLKRYKELGGRLISFSSDAHDLPHLFKGYKLVSQKALELGFKEWTIVKHKKPSQIKIT